jgi:hypothetical protein
MRAYTLAVAILVGCGGGGSSTPKDAMDDGAVDASNGGAHDAAIDAAIDAPGDAGFVPGDAPPDPGVHHHYVIDQLTMPATNLQARTFGIDLNGDAVVDNQLGMVTAVLAGMGMDSQIAMSRAIDTGAAIMLGDVGAVNLTTAPLATFTIYQGANPVPAACTSPQDTVCRKHLTGSGAFSIKQGAPVDPPLAGTIAGGTLTAGAGHLSIQVSLMESAPITLTLLGARVVLDNTTTTSTGKLAGAISMSDITNKVMPELRSGFQAAVVRDCTMLSSPPACGCPNGSTGKTLLGLFDTNQDCTIALAEVQNNSLILSLLAPDVIVEGKMALSLGVGVHMVGGAFTAP